MSFDDKSLELFLQLREVFNSASSFPYTKIAAALGTYPPAITKLTRFFQNISDKTEIEDLNKLWKKKAGRSVPIPNQEIQLYIDGLRALKREGVAFDYPKFILDMKAQTLRYMKSENMLGLYSLYFVSTISNEIRKIPMLLYQGPSNDLKVKLANEKDNYQYFGFALLIQSTQLNFTLIENNQNIQEYSSLKFIVPYGKPTFYEGAYLFLNPMRNPAYGPCVLLKEEIQDYDNIFDHFNQIKPVSIPLSDESINPRIRDFFEANKKFVLNTGFNI